MMVFTIYTSIKEIQLMISIAFNKVIFVHGC